MKTKLLLFAGLLMLSFLWSGLAYSQVVNTQIGNIVTCPGSTNVKVPVIVNNLGNVASISLSLNFSKLLLTYTGYTASTIITTSGGSLLVNAPAGPNGKIIVSWYGLNPIVSIPNGDTLFIFKFTVIGSCPITWDLNTQGACEYTDIDGYPFDATWTSGGITATLPNADFTSTPSVCAGGTASVSVDFTAGTPPFTIIYNDGVNPDVTVTTSDDPYVFTENITTTTTWNLVSISTTSCSNLNVNKSTTSTLSTGPVAFNVTGGGSVCEGGLGAIIGLDSSEVGTSYVLFLDNVTTSNWYTGTDSAMNFGEFTTPGTYTVFGTSSCGTAAMTGNAIIVFSSGPVVTLASFANVCASVQSVDLTGGVPLGGTYSGDGVNNGIFNPSIFGAGTFTITYNVIEGGCSGFATQFITVDSTPIVSLGSYAPVCAGSASFALSGFPVGGTYTGQGMTGDIFDPSLAGIGTWTITYTYSTPGGANCSASATQDVTVTSAPVATISGDTAICIGGSALISVSITGGEAPYYFPFNNGTTVDTITTNGFWEMLVSPSTTNVYSVSSITGANNCSAEVNLATTVAVTPLPEIIFNNVSPLCASSEPILLEASPVGGTFSGLGVNGNYFEPASVGPGLYSVTYTYTSPIGCSNSWTIGISVLPAPEITVNPTDVTANEGTSATFSVTALNATSYHWQVSTDGGLTWVALVNDADYSGVNTDQLVITSVTPAMLGNLYHAVVSGLCAPAATSTDATLNTSMSIVTIAGTVSSCASNTIMVPISVENLNDVAAFSLTLNYGGDLSYIGFQDVNPLIDTGFLSVNGTGGHVKISYFNVVPLNIGNGLLLNIIFSATNGTSPLTWDLGTPGNCEYQNIDYVIIPSQYIDGSVEINQSPDIIFDNVGPLCLNAAPVALAASPSGGVFSGEGVTDGMFYPEVAGVGIWTITYTYSYGSNCTATATKEVTVNALPEVSIQFYTPVCISAESFQLSGSPAGGIYTGDGVLDGIFYPGIAGAGTHTITYSYTDINGCTGIPATTDIVVYALPDITIAASSTSVCVNAEPIELTGTPQGGTFSGTGVTDNFFNPATGIGDWTVTYSYSNELGCSATASTVITVNSLPAVSIDPISPVYSTSGPVLLSGQPAGGVFSGNGVSGGFFNPALVGPGSYEIFYSYTNESGCTAEAQAFIVVIGIPEVTFEPIAAVCANATAFELIALPSGGVFSGTGVANNMFDPAVSGPGTFVVTYTYSCGTGCIVTATQNATVYELPTASLSGGGTVCEGTSATIHIDFLTGTPPFTATFAGGINVQTNEYFLNLSYTPAISMVYTLSSVLDGNGCSSEVNQSVEIVVNPFPTAFNVTGGGSYCSEGTGLNIGLDGSVSGVTYTLYLNGEATSSTLNGTGDPISFNNVMGDGTYTISATNDAGCSAMMTGQATISINPGLIVSAGNDVTIPMGGSTTLSATVLGGTGPYTYLWTPAFDLNDATLATVIANPAATTTYDVMVTDALGCMGVDGVIVTVLPPQNNLSGTITYPNTVSSPLSNVVVTLTDLNGIQADQVTITDAAGHYEFNDLAYSNYILHATSTHIWGGGNSLDGLLMLRHFVGLQFLTGLYLEAGDVTGNGMINAHDSYNTLRRFVGLLPSFAPVGDWVFEHPTVTIDGMANQVVDFNGLCTGDVNASYAISGAKTSPTVTINEEGTVYASNGTIVVPVVAEENMTVSSVSLIVTLPSQAEVKSVDLIGDNANLVYNVIGNELRIGWFSLDPMTIVAGENLLTITLASNSSLDGQTIKIDGNSILSENNAIVIDLARLRVPKISLAAAELSLNSFPNPVNSSATFTYTLPQSGNVMVELFNAIGERVAVITNEFQDAGFHSLSFDASALSQGIYLSRLTVNGSTVNKMISINR